MCKFSKIILLLWPSCVFLTLLAVTLEKASGLKLMPDNRVVEDPRQNTVNLGPMRTVSLQPPDTSAATCDWNSRLTQFLLDETKDRLELKYKLETKITELYEQIQELKNLFVKQQEDSLSSSSANHGIAFSAEVESHLTGLTRDQTIVFANIRTNVGNAYSPSSGVFTCPIKGTYLFSVTILSNLDDRIETEVILQGQSGEKTSVSKLYSGAGSKERYGSGSSTVVLQLEVGDKVWVRVYNGLGSFVYKSWSSFSGVLIQPR